MRETKATSSDDQVVGDWKIIAPWKSTAASVRMSRNDNVHMNRKQAKENREGAQDSQEDASPVSSFKGQLANPTESEWKPFDVLLDVDVHE